MIIVIANKEYRVRWSHITPEQKSTTAKLKVAHSAVKPEAKQPGTICSIYEVAADGKTGARAGIGTAHLSKNDPYIKEKGRKISFQRALQSLQLTKEQREDCWIQYFAEKDFDRYISNMNRNRHIFGEDTVNNERQAVLDDLKEFKRLPLKTKRELFQGRFDEQPE